MWAQHFYIILNTYVNVVLVTSTNCQQCQIWYLIKNIFKSPNNLQNIRCCICVTCKYKCPFCFGVIFFINTMKSNLMSILQCLCKLPVINSLIKGDFFFFFKGILLIIKNCIFMMVFFKKQRLFFNLWVILNQGQSPGDWSCLSLVYSVERIFILGTPIYVCPYRL